MARTNKSGIDYFPFDVDFFNDEKIEFVAARFGVKGEIIALRLLCKIYRNGYYTTWTDDECTLLAKRAGDNITPSLVSDVVNELAKRGFFDESIFSRFAILTSRGIQNRYFEAAKRYKLIEAHEEYLLIDVSKMDNVIINPINVDINLINVNINPQREKEREKENKNKNKEIGEIGNFASPPPALDSEIPVKSSRQEKSCAKKEAAPAFEKFRRWIDDNAPNVGRMKEPFTESEFEKLKQDFTLDQIQNTLQAMHNWKPLLTKKVSANLTFRHWAAKDNKAHEPRTTTNTSRGAAPDITNDELDRNCADRVARRLAQSGAGKVGR